MESTNAIGAVQGAWGEAGGSGKRDTSAGQGVAWEPGKIERAGRRPGVIWKAPTGSGHSRGLGCLPRKARLERRPPFPTGWRVGLPLLAWLGFLLRLAAADPLEEQNVVWTAPSTNDWGTMPLGNGDLALNLRVDPAGDLIFYVSKSDAWDAHARLLKLGRVRVRLSPSPLSPGAPFHQELRLREGEIAIRLGTDVGTARLRVWVDARRPVIRIEGESERPLEVRCTLEPWRTRDRVLDADEAGVAETFGKDAPVVSHADVFPEPGPASPPESVVWYHRNTNSVWETTLRHQGMAKWIPEGRDPLLNRTFGGLMRGEGFRRDSALGLVSRGAVTRFALGVHALTAQTDTADSWLNRLREQADATDGVPSSEARAGHRAWWAAFWDRSWVRVGAARSDNPAAVAAVASVNRGYVLQRFLNACASRGAFPIKFNGSLFTVPLPGKSDPDYRQWGGCYWFQNTRLPYWPMLASGDLDLMEPLFRMYRDALPLARARTRLHFDHGGAYFTETGHFWGAWHNGGMGWGWDRENEPPNRSLNQYIRFHWSGGIELLAMMLDRHAHAPDDAFFRETLLPIADAVLEFYARHYPRQPDGRILFVPAQALETWWETENPTPEVAGLHFVIPQLLAMPAAAIGESRLAAWRKLLAELPPVPRRTEGNQTFVLPGEAFRTRQNMENPELYAVFPFRIFGVGRPDPEVGVETFRRRLFPGNVGWQQDDTQAAFLGLADDARRMLVDRLSRKHPESRFPAFWGPNFDWIPDQTHGGNALMALQTMLLQHVGDRLLLLPAWPRDWDVEFRLHAPARTVVEGTVSGGQVTRLSTFPAGRVKDVEIPAGWR